MQNDQSKKSINVRANRRKTRCRKRGVVDLGTLLTLCVEVVAADDQRTAIERLKHIR